MENNVQDTNEVVLEKPSIFGMILNPGEQFLRIKENPKIIVALLIVTLLTTIGSVMMAQGIDFTNDPNFAGASEEEMMFLAITMQVTFIAVGLFSPVFGALISSVIYLIIAKISGSSVTFKQLFSMSVFIFMITALSFLVNGIAFMATGNGDPEIMFTSLNSFINAGGSLGAFLNTIEIFTIWSMILTAIGLQIVANFSKVLSWSLVIGFYLVTTVFGMLAAGIGQIAGM